MGERWYTEPKRGGAANEKEVQVSGIAGSEKYRGIWALLDHACDRQDQNADYRGTAGVSERNGWFITARRLHEPTCETICRLAELYQIETDFIIGKGFVDPYSDDITEHYFQCKGFNDLGMENITKTMNAIAAEADKVEKSE